MVKGLLVILIYMAVLYVPPVFGDEGPDIVGLSKTVLELSVQNQTLKSGMSIAIDEKEMIEARLNACEDRLESNIRAEVESQKEVDACAAALSRIDKDKEQQKKILDSLREENRHLDEQNHILLKNMEKTRDMGSVIQKSSRTIVGLGDEKAALISENERLLKLNAALELKAKEAVRKAQAIVSRKAAEFFKAIPRKVDVPRYIKDLKIKNTRLGARNVQLTRINADLERSSKEFFIKTNALKDRTDNSKSLAEALKKLNGDHEALKKEHERVQGELSSLRKGLEKERSFLYKEAGVAFMRAELYAEAIHAYLGSLKIDPQDALTYYYLGILYSKVGEQGRATYYLRQYLKLEPRAENKEEVLYIISLVEDPAPQVIR